MEWLIIVFISILSGYSSGKLHTVKDCGKSFVPQGRIINGAVTTPGKYPWMVAIYDDSVRQSPSCGGAILNESWIVTAAHCFFDQEEREERIDLPDISWKDYKVYVGVHDITKMNAPTVQKVQIAKVIIHDKYDDDGIANDIALIKTATPIDIKESKGYVNGICLPPSTPDPSGEATVIGWGKIGDGSKVPAKLMEANVPLVPWQTCKKIYADPKSEFENLTVVPSMLCAGGNGKDACQFDSGGPLFQVDKKGVATLIGTVANGAGCGYKHYPGMYMKVSAFKTWMDKVTT